MTGNFRQNKNQDVFTGITSFIEDTDELNNLEKVFYEAVLQQDKTGKAELKCLKAGFIPVPTIEEKAMLEKATKERMKQDLAILYHASKDLKLPIVKQLECAKKATDITDMYDVLEEHNITKSYDRFHKTPSSTMYELLHDIIVIPYKLGYVDMIAVIAYYSDFTSNNMELVEQYKNAHTDEEKLKLIKAHTRPIVSMLYTDLDRLPIKMCAGFGNEVNYTDEKDPEIIMTAVIADQFIKSIRSAMVDKTSINE